MSQAASPSGVSGTTLAGFIRSLGSLPEHERTKVIDRAAKEGLLSRQMILDLYHDFFGFWAHDGQHIPKGNWAYWLILAGRGSGKGSLPTEVVPTPDGWSQLGDLHVGDRVFDESGRLCRVTGIYDYTPPKAYRFWFNDGSSLTTCDEHQWVTWTHSERKALLRSAYERKDRFPNEWPAWRAMRNPGNGRLPEDLVEKALERYASGESFRSIERTTGLCRFTLSKYEKHGGWYENHPYQHESFTGPRIRTTEEIVRTFRVGKRGDLNHCIPTCGPLETVTKNLPIDPYVLGLWLGGGSSRDGTIFCGTQDIGEIRELVESKGYTTTDRRDPIQFGVVGLTSKLAANGLTNNKHVPEAYLRASIEQRTELLRGLMDSDGTSDQRGSVEFCNKNRRLSEAVHELVCSLGQKPTIRTAKSTLYGKDCGERHRVSWSPTIDPFRLSRKSASTERRFSVHHRMISDYEEVDPVPMRCIEVDSRHSMYLLGKSMIPTHNTRCIEEGTKVLTDFGYVPIEIVGAGQEVMTTKGMRVVEWCDRTAEIADLFVLQAEDAPEPLRLTGDHQVFSPGVGWVEAQNLARGDMVMLCGEGGKFFPSRVTGCRRSKLRRPVWNLHVKGDGPPEFVANGFLVHNCGAEWVNKYAFDHPGCHIALVAETKADGRDVMIEAGSSSIIVSAHPQRRPVYEPSKRRVVWPNGSFATLYSGDEPTQLRGPQHHASWVDELCKYDDAEATMDMLNFGLRLGENPQCVITTTPAPNPVLVRLLKQHKEGDSTVAVSRMSTYDNRSNLPKSFLQNIESKYEGTRLGKAEIFGEMLDDMDGALWSASTLDDTRVHAIPPWQRVMRVVVAVDPAVTVSEDSAETGISVCALAMDERENREHFYVLADLSGKHRADGLDGWGAQSVIALVEFGASWICGETNHGGDLVEGVIQQAARDLQTRRRGIPVPAPFNRVKASHGKQVRAQPVSMLWEQGRAHIVGSMPLLESQMCTYTGERRSASDRLDAMVWAITDLLYGGGSAEVF